MKKSLACLILTLLTLVLARPFYIKDIVKISFEAKSNRYVGIRLFYSENEKETLEKVRFSRNFDIADDHYVTFNLPVKRLYSLKIGIDFNQRFIRMGPVTAEGTGTKTLFPIIKGGPDKTYKHLKIYREKAGEITFSEPFDIQGTPVFYPSALIIISAVCFIFFYLIFTFKIMAVIAAAIAGYTAFTLTGTGPDLGYDRNLSYPNGFFGAFAGFAFLILYYKTYIRRQPPLNILLLVLSLGFAVLNSLAFSMYYSDSWRLIAEYPLTAVIATAGLAVLFYTAGLYLFDLFSSGFLMKKGNSSAPSKFFNFYSTHTVLSVFIVIFLCWIPWHIACYPGFASKEMYEQFLQSSEKLPLYSRHTSLFLTFISGIFFRLGAGLKNEDMGLYLYLLFQSAVCAYVFALCLDSMKKMGLRPAFQAAGLFFFAVFPFGGFLFIYADGGILYGAVLLLFTLQTAHLAFFSKPEPKQRQIVLYAVTFLLLCLLRKDGVYTAGITAAVLLPTTVPPKSVYRMTVCLLASFFTFLFLTKSLFPFMGFTPDNRREMLSIPFQQTARYLKYHAENISQEEMTQISRTLDTAVIADAYNPIVSDPVKNTYRLNLNPEENRLLKNYFKTWFKMFFRHPETYLQATMANSFAYYTFTPYFQPERLPSPDDGFYPEYRQEASVLKQFFKKIYFLASWNIPFSYLLYGFAFYTWLLALIGVFFLTNGMRKALIPMIPAACAFLACIASPVNGLLQYYLPVMMCLPFLFAFAASSDKKRGADT